MLEFAILPNKKALKKNEIFDGVIFFSMLMKHATIAGIGKLDVKL